MNIITKLYIWLVRDRWSLGFIEEPLESIICGNAYDVHYVTGIPKDRWYADPFILSIDNNTIELLVEAWIYKKHKGCLARLEIARDNYSLRNESIILELGTHLSFPFIQRIDGEVFVSPENSYSGEWNQYKYNLELDKLYKTKNIISKPLTDAISTNLFGEELIFSTCLPNANGPILSIYSTEGEVIQDVIFDGSIARGAGDWFTIGKRIFRPAQDCNAGYGCAVIIQEVKKTKDGFFAFENVCRIESKHPVFDRGLHTFNHYKGLIVVDLRGYKREILGRVTDKIRVWFKRKIKHA